jgi:glycosyltransferase involved in cell wall biosynthesis
MTGENIICFAKDWAEDPTSNNHVMRQLARGNQVLWLNSISTRTPSLSSGRDLKKIVLKLASFMRGAKQVDELLWVYTPIVLPFPHSRMAAALNRSILRATLRMLRRKLGMNEFQLWTFLPNVVDYVGTLGESLVVYYCVDEWSKFSYVDGPKIAAAEARLCREADVVFATAQSLVERRRALNPNTFLASHGVDHELFAAALRESTAVPADLAALPQPVLGFYGTIQDWVDLDLIAFLAERHPEWSIAMIGRASVDTECFSRYPNVHFLGRRDHSTLPAYCKGFAVGLIPYILNERILHVNPIKLREYLSAGLPVVSTAVPEVSRYGDLCHVAESYEEFERGIETALREDTPERRSQRSDGMRAETWEKKVAEVGARVMEVEAERAAQRSQRPTLRRSEIPREVSG